MTAAAAAPALLDRSLEASHAPDSPEVTRGRDAVRAIFDQWLDMFDDWSIEVSGARAADAYEIRDGLIERVVWGSGRLGLLPGTRPR